MNVNALLFCVYAGAEMCAILPHQFIADIQDINGVHTTLVEPLRAIRRRTRNNKHYDEPGIEKLHTSMKVAELHAEYVEQNLIYKLACQQKFSQTGGQRAASIENVTALLAFCVGREEPDLPVRLIEAALNVAGERTASSSSK